MNIIRFSLIVLTCALQIISCATRGSPGGGPVDRTPPEIVNTLPASDSVRVSPFLSKIEINFSSTNIEGFNIVLQPIFEKIKNNASQIQTLAKIRDTLLPKLMSGEIRVEGIDQ